jgi:hypothetical protein
MQDKEAGVYPIIGFPSPARELGYPLITSQGRPELLESKPEISKNQRNSPRIVNWAEAWRKTSAPDTETINRLNELARQRPFCCYYKTKKFDPL